VGTGAAASSSGTGVYTVSPGGEHAGDQCAVGHERGGGLHDGDGRKRC
jgi:hypothetical protein